ncbi:MAG: class IV adenylate cyclase [Thermoplasmata archaeon]
MEVESKYRSPGNEKVEKALDKLGAELICEDDTEDVYFQHPGRDFGKTDEALRLRKKGGGSELTYKGPRMKLEHTKAREEVTLRTDDPLAAQRIVERLGFKEFMSVRKKRRNFKYDKIRVAVDDVEGLGEYVELELITEEPKRAEALIEQMRKELALTDLEPKTYLELILDKRTRSDDR